MRSAQVLLISSLGVLVLGVGIIALAPDLSDRIIGALQFGTFRMAVNTHHMLYGTDATTRPSIESAFLSKAMKMNRKLDPSKVNNPNVFRKDFEKNLPKICPYPSYLNITRNFHTVPVSKGESIELLWLDFPVPRSRATKHITVVYLHGGGFIEGSINSYEGAIANIVNELQQLANADNDMLHYSIVIPQYRLAPEYPLPTAIEDCLEAYKYILKQTTSNENSILFIGDSAGGHLVVSTTLSAIKNNIPVPKSLIAFSPWTDLTNSNPSVQTNKDNDAVLTPAMINKFSDWAAPSDKLKKEFSLLSKPAEDFADLPPLLVQAGSYELLLDDAILFAKLTGCEIEIYDSQIHDFNLFVGWIPEAYDALRTMNKFIKHHYL